VSALSKKAKPGHARAPRVVAEGSQANRAARELVAEAERGASRHFYVKELKPD